MIVPFPTAETCYSQPLLVLTSECISQSEAGWCLFLTLTLLYIVLCWLMTSLLTGDAWSVGTTSSYVKYHPSWTEEKPSGKIRPFNSFPYEVNVRKSFHNSVSCIYPGERINSSLNWSTYSNVEKPCDKYHGKDKTMEVAFVENVNLIRWFSLYPWSWFKLCIFISSCYVKVCSRSLELFQERTEGLGKAECWVGKLNCFLRIKAIHCSVSCLGLYSLTPWWQFYMKTSISCLVHYCA